MGLLQELLSLPEPYGDMECPGERGSWTGKNSQVMLFSAMLQGKGVTIAQVRVPDGINETTPVKALAEQADMHEGESALVTLDAAHRRVREILAPLLGNDSDDVITGRGRGVIKTWSCWVSGALAKDVAVAVTSRNAERMTAADLNKHAREHRGIENKRHYIHDTAYRKDGNQTWNGDDLHAPASFRDSLISLFAMKQVKNIKEATAIVHLDRRRALHYI